MQVTAVRFTPMAARAGMPKEIFRSLIIKPSTYTSVDKALEEQVLLTVMFNLVDLMAVVLVITEARAPIEEVVVVVEQILEQMVQH